MAYLAHSDPANPIRDQEHERSYYGTQPENGLRSSPEKAKFASKMAQKQPDFCHFLSIFDLFL
jgi:hypothetical protein